MITIVADVAVWTLAQALNEDMPGVLTWHSRVGGGRMAEVTVTEEEFFGVVATLRVRGIEWGIQ